MAGSYSMDLRARVVAAVDDGGSVAVVAKRFEVSQTFVRTLLQRRRQSGSFAVRTWRPGPRPKLAEHGPQLRALVAARPDATLHELREQLPVRVSVSTLWCALRDLGFALKKSSLRGRAATA